MIVILWILEEVRPSGNDPFALLGGYTTLFFAGEAGEAFSSDAMSSVACFELLIARDTVGKQYVFGMLGTVGWLAQLV